MELPSTKGNVNDVLRINSVGYGASINLTSNNLGVIINATVNNSGLQGYDSNYLPEVNTEVNMTGSILKENGIVHSLTSGPTNTIKISSLSSGLNNYYIGWIIETINPNSERIITGYNVDSVNNLKANIIFKYRYFNCTNTQYKLIQGHGYGYLNILTITDEDDNSNSTTTLTLSSSFTSFIGTTVNTTLNTTDGYYNNWSIVLDDGGNIYKGTITSFEQFF